MHQTFLILFHSIKDAYFALSNSSEWDRISNFGSIYFKITALPLISHEEWYPTKNDSFSYHWFTGDKPERQTFPTYCT